MKGPYGQNRFIFRSWPRDPKGQVIRSELPLRGKYTAPWLELWGETLYDFYGTERIPGVPNLRTLTTGSRMAATMRMFGELDAAPTEIAWADREASPREVPPFDIGTLVKEFEEKCGPDYDLTTEDAIARGLPKLERFLPFHLLPEKLIVHDPYHTLKV
ncbi:hypothetical protein K488DRAFT_59721, partial [Vararia minispora EC-137]